MADVGKESCAWHFQAAYSEAFQLREPRVRVMHDDGVPRMDERGNVSLRGRLLVYVRRRWGTGWSENGDVRPIGPLTRWIRIRLASFQHSY
jgi:hypothetical protein